MGIPKVQFFISYLPNQGVYNPVAEAVRKRIARAHANNETFRVYLVITLLPEVGGKPMMIVCCQSYDMLQAYWVKTVVPHWRH